MIRYSLFLGVVVILLGCSKIEKEYPQVVVNNQLEEQFDIAKFEAYKIIGGIDCNCKGVINSDNPKDTFNLLALDLELVDLEITGDTIFYYMDFFAKDEDMQIKQTTTLSKSYGDCFDFIGIGFLGKSTTPFLAYIDDKGVIDFSDSHYYRIRDSIFYNCISKKDVKINPWLESYLELNN